jgi:hypothetical protein
MQYQEELNPKFYSTWVSSYITDDYKPDFISPFSGNEDTLLL